MKGPDRPIPQRRENVKKQKPEGGLARKPLCPPQAVTMLAPVTPGTVRPQELSARALNS